MINEDMKIGEYLGNLVVDGKATIVPNTSEYRLDKPDLLIRLIDDGIRYGYFYQRPGVERFYPGYHIKTLAEFKTITEK
ncbi:MAG TPA: hypothetical protein V6D27_01005 [Vampirovibrionales bacterium]